MKRWEALVKDLVEEVEVGVYDEPGEVVIAIDEYGDISRIKVRSAVLTAEAVELIKEIAGRHLKHYEVGVTGFNGDAEVQIVSDDFEEEVEENEIPGKNKERR